MAPKFESLSLRYPGLDLAFWEDLVYYAIHENQFKKLEVKDTAHHSGLATLKSLSLVDRVLYGITRPHILEHVKISTVDLQEADTRVDTLYACVKPTKQSRRLQERDERWKDAAALPPKIYIDIKPKIKFIR
jgi:hypothetical protein